MKTGFVFPGQASQYVGMGKEFIEMYPECKEIVEKGEKITNLPLMEKIMNGPMEELTRTLICQPAVFCISLVCWTAFRKNSDLIPDFVAGHSLGEYTALVASGVINLEEGFYIVKRRAQIMDEISQKVNGTLLAVIGMKIGELEEAIKNFEGVEISNINSYSQIIVGGKKEKLMEFSKFLKERGVKPIFLKVTGPFHTSFMKSASKLLEEEIIKVDFKEPEIPVFLNYSGNLARDREEVKEGLVKQLYSPVKWLDIIKNMEKENVEIFVEVGPKKVLKKLIESILPGKTVLNVEDKNSLEETLNYLGGENV
ncbi:ACP S-malonyltransferase [bacterium]|nr:ACP S-malonyltransferase [bacterium]